MSLRLDGVAKDFAGVHSVRQASLELAPGEIVGLVGPNGSGKTTLVNLASGAVVPSRGRVLVDSVDLTGATSPRFAAAGVVRTFQALRLFEGLSVLDNVLIGAQRRLRPSLVSAFLRPPRFRRRERELRERALATLEEVDMAGFAGRPVAALSHGQRRRVEVARALAAGPAYLVLDEPGVGLAPEQLDHLVAALQRRGSAGTGVLVVEHDVRLVGLLCQRVLGMADGAVVTEGPLSTVAAHPALAAHLRGVPG